MLKKLWNFIFKKLDEYHLTRELHNIGMELQLLVAKCVLYPDDERFMQRCQDVYELFHFLPYVNSREVELGLNFVCNHLLCNKENRLQIVKKVIEEDWGKSEVPDTKFVSALSTYFQWVSVMVTREQYVSLEDVRRVLIQLCVEDGSYMPTRMVNGSKVLRDCRGIVVDIVLDWAEFQKYWMYGHRIKTCTLYHNMFVYTLEEDHGMCRKCYSVGFATNVDLNSYNQWRERQCTSE